MLTGLFYLGADDISNGVVSLGRPVHKGTSAENMVGYYYFTIDGDHSSAEGQMVTNKRVTLDVHGDDETYYFDKNGKAYTYTVISNCVYGGNGQLITAYGDGNTYQRVALGNVGELVNGKYQLVDKKGNVVVSGDATDQILLNENGKIKLSGSAKDVNEDNVKLDSNGIVSTVNDVAVK